MGDHLSEFFCTGDHHVRVFAHRRTLVGIVDGSIARVEIEHLEIAAGVEGGVGFFEDGEGVFKIHCEKAAVDVVGLFFAEPVILGVVDFKTAVGRYADLDV